MNMILLNKLDILAEHTELGVYSYIYMNGIDNIGVYIIGDGFDNKLYLHDFPYTIYDFQAIRYGGIYKLLENDLYKVHGIVIDVMSETPIPCVLYQALYDDKKYYIRPYKMFVSESVLDVRTGQKYRFELVE